MKQRKRLLSFACFGSAAVLFTLLVAFVGKAPVGPAGTEVGFAGLNNAIAGVFPYNGFFYTVSKLVGFLAIAVAGLFSLLAVLEFVQRKSIRRIDAELLALVCTYALTVALYVLFEVVVVNYRPIIMPGEVMPEASFPSSHTLLAVTIFGSALFAMTRYLKDERVRRIVRVVFLVFIAVMTVGRLVSGVHWFTDILGGVLYSLALISFYRLMLEVFRKSAKHHAPRKTR
ncbi:MAG: phosphatase PAP2 family protein [Clostridia bacterium]|nr:phosphatase PAP2 family protein [Clostridia bacterium]